MDEAMRGGAAGNPSRIVPIAALRRLVEDLLRAAGCEADIASIVVDVHLEADLRGHSLQGLDHVVYYLVRAIKSGRIAANARPTVTREAPAYALVDGHFGLGQLDAVFAADLAITKAKDAGCATIGIVNSNDVYIVGYYPERIARQGLVGIMLTDAVPNAHPVGGVERLIGANVMGVAVPTAGKDPFLLDFAVTHSFLSRMGAYARAGLPLPDGFGVDSQGVPTNDPAAVLAGGAVSPIAGHKGFGLAIAIALLSGPLVGASVGPELGRSIYGGDLQPTGEISDDWLDRLEEDRYGPRGSKGHLLIAIDPGMFGDEGVFLAAATAYLDLMKASRRAPGVEEILIPGERSFRERSANLERGTVAVEENAWKGAVGLAGVLGVEVPPV
jgi:LDH2 family malate/lactate/ureidoglycolate dehydrogenase